MNFNVGDIILQKKDKITFTVVEKKGIKLVLEYYDTHTKSIRNITMNKVQLETQFSERPQDLEHFKVILK